MRINFERVCMIAVLSVACIAFTINFLGFHNFIGGADEGSYVAVGRLISEGKGLFVFYDPIVANGSKIADPNYFLPFPFVAYGGPGFFVDYWSKGYPIISSVFWFVFGYQGFRMVNPLLASLSMVLTFLVCKRLGITWGGVVASWLLATSWLELWYARYPMSEISSQFFFLASIYFAIRYWQSGKSSSLLLLAACSCFGLVVHLQGFPTLLGIWVIVGCVLLRKTKGSMFTKSSLTSVLAAACAVVAAPILTLLLLLVADPGFRQYYSPFFLMLTGLANPTSVGAASPGGSGFTTLNLAAVSYFHILLSFVPVPIAILGIVGLFELLREPTERVVWLSLIVVSLGVAYGLLRQSTLGAQADLYVLYAGRRLMWSIIPILYVSVGVFSQRTVNRLCSSLSLTRQKMLKISVVVLVALAVTSQVGMYLPFQAINKGQGFPTLASMTQHTLMQRGSLPNSIVIMGNYSPLFDSGMRYVYGVPIVSVRAPLTLVVGTIIPYELHQNRSVYALDDSASQLRVTIEKAGYRCTKLWTYSTLWYSGDAVGLYEWPITPGLINMTFTLYEVSSMNG